MSKYTMHIEDDDKMQTILDADTMQCFIWELKQHLRTKLKYPDDSVSEDTFKAYEEISAFVYSELGDRNLLRD